MFNDYFNSNGRASKQEFWYFQLANSVVLMLLSALGLCIDFIFLSYIYSLIALSPTISVLVRRLHDVSLAGWWGVLLFVPLVGTALLVYNLLKPSEIGPNFYGSEPKVR